jgi:hypothetical protein
LERNRRQDGDDAGAFVVLVRPVRVYQSIIALKQRCVSVGVWNDQISEDRYRKVEDNTRKTALMGASSSQTGINPIDSNCPKAHKAVSCP